MSDKRDVTGLWFGSFSGTGDVYPNRFIAVLAEAGGRISGTTSEPDGLGDADLLRADVSGNRVGPVVRFVKQYDGAAHCAHAVDYQGRIDAEGTEISGDWRFAQYSGQFVMNRERFTEDELEEDRVVMLYDEIDER